MDELEARTKYAAQVESFIDRMYAELAANEFKGGAEAWQQRTDESGVYEIVYHAFKLALALREGSLHFALEYAADVGNLAMMVFDKAQREMAERQAADDAVVDYEDDAFLALKGPIEGFVATWFQPPDPKAS